VNVGEAQPFLHGLRTEARIEAWSFERFNAALADASLWP
jgi:hypothetical protein